jgi:hypothetical protein
LGTATTGDAHPLQSTFVMIPSFFDFCNYASIFSRTE